MTERATTTVKSAINRFLNGSLFPPLLCLLVLIGHFGGVEYYTNILLFFCVYAVFLFSSSVKPLMGIAVVFIYQLSVQNSPSAPVSSMVHFTGWKLTGLFILGGLFFVSLAVYFKRVRAFSRLSFRKTPLLLTLFLFFVSQLLGGLLAGGPTLSNVAWAGGNAFAMLALFFIFYVGIQEDDPVRLTGYFAKFSGWISFLLFIEVVGVYLTTPGMFNDEGFLQKELVFTGWAISNPIGVALAVLIPIDLYPLIKGKKGAFFAFFSALVAWIGTFLTVSRNAILFSTAVFVISLTICIFVKRKRNIFLFLSLIFFALAFVVYLNQERITGVLVYLIANNLSVNGRFDLWQKAWAAFRESPIFGKGFFQTQIGASEFGSFIPEMAHNTFLQLMAASGLVGLVAYLLYRLETFKLVFKRPSIEKWVLFLSVLVLLGESMFDVFIFLIYPTFHYSACLAIICLLDQTAKRASKG